MTSWDVSPSGVQAVLVQTSAVAQEFDAELRQAGDALASSATGSSSGIVAQALSGFAEQLGTDMQAVAARTSSALTGCARATQAYVDGDLEMAANAARAAAQAPRPSMPGPR